MSGRGTKGRRDEGTKGQRDKGTEGQSVGDAKREDVKREGKGCRHEGT